MDNARFARIISMKAKPGKGNEFLRVFRKEVMSTAVELEGMRRLYLFRQVGKEDEFVALSLWDNEKAAENYAKSGSDRKYSEKLAGVQEGKERVRKFYVESHVVGKSVDGGE
jgi:heme-degrading monooxygenase HmoA